MSDNKKVSIIVPCYNQAEFLKEAIESVILQTYENWECIIVNDGSTDDTDSVSNELIKQDQRISCYKQINKGVSVARNMGISICNGEYILPLDADDKISPDYISLAVAEMNKNSNVKVVYCEPQLFGATSAKWILPDFSLKQLVISNMIFCSSLFRKEDWTRIGGFDKNMCKGFEDWEFWINLLKNGGDVVKLSHTGFFYRIKEVSRNTSISETDVKQLEDYISTKHAGFIYNHIGNPISLKKQLDQYAATLNYITNKPAYRFLRYLKRIFYSNQKMFF